MTEDWINLYEQYAASVIDSPPCFHPYIAHAILGCAAGKRVWIQGFADEPIRPNMFLLILGNSSRTRKTRTFRVGTRLLKDASIPQLIGTASPESIRDEISEDEKGSCIDGWFHIEEFGRILKLAQKDYARDIDLFYCQLYDGVVKGRTKKEGRVLRDDLALTVLTSCPQRTLESDLDREAFASGFIARFLIVPAPRRLPPKNYNRRKGDVGTKNILVAHIHKLRDMKAHEAAVEDAAEAIIINACRDIDHRLDTGAIPELLDACACRLQTALWKFALSSACADLKLPSVVTRDAKITIKPQDAQIAVQRVQWLIDSLILMVSDLTFTPRAAAFRQIEQQIERAGEIPARDLSRDNRNIDGKDIDGIVKRLMMEGLIEVVSIKTKGRPKQVYRWCANGRDQSHDENELP